MKEDQNKMNPIEQVRRDPEGTMGEIKSKGLSGFLEEGERLGQLRLANNDLLPTNMQGNSRTVLEKAGVKFPSPDENTQNTKRQLFQSVELPHGWKKVPFFDMWSKLVDDKGRVRANIYYKPQENNSFLYVMPRLSVDIVEKDGLARGVVKDGENVLYETPTLPASSRGEAQNRTTAWINKFYPDFRDESAYWDEDIKRDKEKGIEWPIVGSFPVAIDYDLEEFFFYNLLAEDKLPFNRDELPWKVPYNFHYKGSNGYGGDLYYGRSVLADRYHEWLKEHPKAEANKAGMKNIIINLVDSGIFQKGGLDGMSRDEIVDRLAREGLRPATAEESLAFQDQHQEYPNQDTRIVAFGSSFTDKNDKLNNQAMVLYKKIDLPWKASSTRPGGQKIPINGATIYEQFRLQTTFSDKDAKWLLAAVKI